MTNTEKFFVECIKKGIKNEKIQTVPQEIDYKKLYKLCVSHSTSVIVLKALEDVKAQLLPKFWETLQRLVRKHLVLDVQGEYDKKEFLLALEENGIKHMPLKGYHLKALYPYPEMRYTADCDVLIDVEQLKKVRALVKKLNLVTKRHDEHHDIVYYPTTKTVFELHKSLFVGPLKEYFGIGFERAKLQEGKKARYVLSPEDFYMTMLAHSAYHFAEGGGVGIRHVTDVYLYKKAHVLNIEYLDKELEKCGLLRFKNAFESLAEYFFDDAPATEQTLRLAKSVVESALFENVDKKPALEVLSNVENGGLKKAKSKAFWLALFPKKQSMQYTYPILKKAVWLLPLFYPIRWIHVLFTRPKNIGKLKGYQKVEESALKEVKTLRDGLGIEHLL